MSILSSKIKQSDNISAKRYFVLPMKSREYLKSSYYSKNLSRQRRILELRKIRPTSRVCQRFERGWNPNLPALKCGRACSNGDVRSAKADICSELNTSCRFLHFLATDDAPFFFNRYKTTGFSLGDIAVQVKPAKQVNGTNTSYYKKELSFAVSAPVSLPTHTTVVSSAAVPTPTTAFSVLLPLPAPTPTPTPYYTGKKTARGLGHIIRKIFITVKPK
ncbi:hypothetical protein BDF21DRAFT_463318 [Thamnidium elegans]|nr:hypothetical protein BDF21DRAFT_463318 [Thamnidium elegans]